MFKEKVEPENFFYSMLLLKKPWRNTDELMNNCHSYKEAFLKSTSDFPDLLTYYEKITHQALQVENMEKLIEEETKKIESDEKNKDCSLEIEDLDCIPQENLQEIKECKGIADKNLKDKFDWQHALNIMSVDQKRVYDYVFGCVKDGKKICRKFVTGEAGTGKSFLIRTLFHSIHERLNKKVLIVAPTGIAAFNVGGMTIHKLFQLP